MEFPKRTTEHVTESASWKILQAKTPAAWILREVTERDYGIDAYIEITSTKGEVTGNLCSIQLKGTEKIEWKEGENGPRSTLSVSTTTVNYWMHLPVPVFLVLADLSTGRAHFAPVKPQVRKRFKEYLSQKSVSFHFTPDAELGTEAGDLAFILMEVRETFHERFHATLREFLIHWEQYLDFIQEHSGWDVHLGIESNDEMMFVHIFTSSKFLADFLEVDWPFPPLAEIYKSEEHWNDQYYRLHQHTLNPLLESLEPVYLAVLDKCRDYVLTTQKEYWRIADRLLVEHCHYLNFQQHLDEIAKRKRP